jgi:uncharacterized membrane protein YfcA
LLETEVIIGLAIGLAIGTTGVGGGVLTAPILILFLGLPAAQSVGTALIFSAAVKVAATLLYVYRRQVDFRVLGYLLIGGIPGALGGALLERWWGDKQNGSVLSLVGATIVVSAGFSLFRSLGGTLHQQSRLKLLPYLSLLIGLEVGFSSAGAGALGTVMLFNFTKLAPVVIVSTDLVFGMLVSAVGGGIHAMAGSWNSPVLLKLLQGGLAGVPAGSWLAGILPQRMLRIVVLLWAVLFGVLLVYKGMGKVN